MKVCLLLLLAMTALAQAGGQESTNYTDRASSLGGGGSRSISANYSQDGSIGGFGGALTGSLTGTTNRTGYIAQLSEITGFALSAPSTNLNEGTSMPLFAIQFVDDGTVTPVNNYAHWSFAAPITGVDASGIVTVGNVSQNTPTMVQASLEERSTSINLMVLNVDVPPGYNHITCQYLGAGQMRLSFVGLPETQYSLERTYNLAPPVTWLPLLTNTAGGDGLLVFTNLVNPATNNFWRVRSVP